MPTFRGRARNFVVLGLLALPARDLGACSPAPIWAIRDSSLLTFIATTGADTLLAGPGPTRPVDEPGHFGRGGGRPIHGQRVRLDVVSGRVVRAIGSDARDAVLVPWDYAADCSPVAWSRSARWLEPGTRGLIRARLRAREHWVGDLPTFDVVNPARQPYPHALRSDPWMAQIAEGPLVPAEELVELLDALPSGRLLPDSLEERALIERFRSDTARAGAYPISAIIRAATWSFRLARMQAIRAPFVGTLRLEASFNGGRWRPFFVRTAPRPTTTFGEEGFAPPSDDDPFAVLPFSGYDVYSVASSTLEGLPRACGEANGDDPAFAYVGIERHAPLAPAEAGTWRAYIDERLFVAILTPSEIIARDSAQRVTLAQSRAGILLRPPTPDRGWTPSWDMRFTRRRQGAPLRLAGEMALPPHGRVQIRGEWISAVTYTCGG